jgi:hypothetical protein
MSCPVAARKAERDATTERGSVATRSPPASPLTLPGKLPTSARSHPTSCSSDLGDYSTVVARGFPASTTRKTRVSTGSVVLPLRAK